MRGALVAVADISWELVRPWIEAACLYNGGRYSFEDCRKEIEEGKKHLWLASDDKIKGVILSSIVQFPRKKCAFIDICTGEELVNWGDMVALIEEWARLKGCEQMFLIAREGMGKLLKKHDYRKTHGVFEKDL